jgi:hypothetical protein
MMTVRMIVGSFPRDLKSECVELDGKDRHD